MAILITPRDLLAPAGEPALLEVEVERRLGPFLDPPLEGLRIEVEGGGSARSDPSGEAAIPLGELGVGTHRVIVRATPKRGQPVEAEALVRVIPPEAPIFITDIDHTIADVSPTGFIFKPNHRVLPVTGAREALAEIAHRMELLYLSARDHIFLRKTRGWLRLNQFPEAPLYLRRRTRFTSVRAKEHKRARLAELRSRFRNLRWGIGDVAGDIEAYSAHGIPAILLARSIPPGLPASTLHVQEWRSVLPFLGSPEGGPRS
jgi:hypothetical protein